MKTLLVSFATLIVVATFTINLQAQPKANDEIESIRRHYANINQNVGRYRRVKKEVWGFSPEGGELTAYFQGPSVMKMVAMFLGETGRAVEQYYYWDGKLIFVLSTDNRYDQPLSGKVVRKEETRLYFKDDKLIRWIGENGKEVASDSPEYATKQADYLKLSKLLSDGAKSKARKIESPD